MPLFPKIAAATEQLNHKLARVQCLTGNTLKIIAILAMVFDYFCKIILQWLIDHYWYALAQAGQITIDRFYEIDWMIRSRLYPVGTIAFPLFAFLLVEGFRHTSNRKRYIDSMLFFALVSELPFDLGFFSSLSERAGTFPFYWGYQNIFFTLFLGLLALIFLETFSAKSESRAKNLVLQFACVFVIAQVAELIQCDYAGEGIWIIAAFYITRKNRIWQVLGFLAAYILTTGEQPSIFILLACLLILLYNGTRGKLKLKYFFYAFYPVHIAFFYLVTLLLPFVLQ